MKTLEKVEIESNTIVKHGTSRHRTVIRFDSDPLSAMDGRHISPRFGEVNMEGPALSLLVNAELPFLPACVRLRWICEIDIGDVNISDLNSSSQYLSSMLSILVFEVYAKCCSRFNASSSPMFAR